MIKDLTWQKKLHTMVFGSWRSAAYAWRSRFSPAMPAASKTEVVDVVIPMIEKDLTVLPLCVEGLRRCITNRTGNIYLVSPDSDSIRRAAVRHGLAWVEEGSVLGYLPSDMSVISRSGRNRSGWIFQQLLKLSGRIGENRFFVVIDADHILLQPHTFVTDDGRQVFYQSKEYYYPYYDNIYRLMGQFPHAHLSYIAHKMVFDKETLLNLRTRIEQRSAGVPWDKAIVESLNRYYDSSFSEFETYGHFVAPEKKVLLPWKQKELVKTQELPTYEELHKAYGEQFRSVTFPDYLKAD